MEATPFGRQRAPGPNLESRPVHRGQARPGHRGHWGRQLARTQGPYRTARVGRTQGPYLVKPLGWRAGGVLSERGEGKDSQEGQGSPSRPPLANDSSLGGEV